MEHITDLPRLKPREVDGHKGDYGTVVAIAGGRGLAGAAALVGLGALRSGAGKVRIACPVEVQPTVAGFCPEYMTWPLAQDDRGTLVLEGNEDDLTEIAAPADAIGVGPGWGRRPGAQQLLRWVLAAARVPLVIDADGLFALASLGVQALSVRPAPTVLTPHVGEFSRLTGLEVRQIQAQRVESAVALAQRCKDVVVVLKGSRTLVTDGKRVFTNNTGNPGMATGGSGDVLTGVIAALIGQGLEPFEAAQLGVHAHGLAGDLARDRLGTVGMLAGDIAAALPEAFAHLEQPPTGRMVG